MDGRAHLALIADELALLARRPLSLTQAHLVVALLDAAPDRLYADRREAGLAGEHDRASFRAALLAESPALACIAALGRGDARVAVHDVTIPRDAVMALDVRDFMVSLYNDQTVPRLMIDGPGAQSDLAEDVLSEAATFLRRHLPASERAPDMPVFSHVMVGARDAARMTAFYDAVLAPLGLKRDAAAPVDDPAGAIWRRSGRRWAQFAVRSPYDGAAATPGNGSMVSFAAPSRAAVEMGWRAALAHGGQDEGAPGLRPRYAEDFFAAYARDPEGNKFCLLHANGLESARA